MLRGRCWKHGSTDVCPCIERQAVDLFSLKSKLFFFFWYCSFVSGGCSYWKPSFCLEILASGVVPLPSPNLIESSAPLTLKQKEWCGMPQCLLIKQCWELLLCGLRKKIYRGSSSDCALMLNAFLLLYICLFLTVKVSGWGEGKEDFFFLSSVLLVFIYRIIFPRSFPPSFSWQNKIQGRSISCLTRRKKGADGGRRKGRKRELLARQQLTLVFNL